MLAVLVLGRMTSRMLRDLSLSDPLPDEEDSLPMSSSGVYSCVSDSVSPESRDRFVTDILSRRRWMA